MMRSQQQSRRALQPAERFATSTPMCVHPCFAPLLPLFPAAVMSALLFDADAAPTLEPRVSALLTAAPSSRAIAAARSSLRAVIRVLRAAGLLHELALSPGQEQSLVAHIADASLQSLAQLLSAAARCLLGLDDLSRTALLQDESGGFALELEQLISSLSFLLASASSAAIVTPNAPPDSFVRLQGFHTQLRTTVPRAVLLSAFELVGVLLRASSSLALVFVEQGAAWAWLVSWLQPATAVRLDSTLQTAVLAMVNALLQHPQSILALDAQQLIPTNGHARDSLSALLSCSILAASSLRSPLVGPVRRADRPLVHGIRLKVQLHQLVAAVSAAFGEAQGQHDTHDTDEHMRAQHTLASHMRNLITFMAASGEQNGEPGLAASLSAAFLQHALQFQLLSVLQFMLSAAGSVRGITFGPPFDVFTEFVRPILMLGFFGAHCSIQHAMHVVSEERVSHQLLQSMRHLTLTLKSQPIAHARGDQLDPTPPWRQVRALLDWIEGHVQALLLVSHCSGVHVASLCPSWSMRVRCAAWSALCAFVQTHPFGVECTLYVLRQAQAWSADADAAGSHPPPELPFAFLHRLFVCVFEVESAYAPLLQSHALTVLATLMRSIHATQLFFGRQGRLPVSVTAGLHCTPDALSFVSHAMTAVGLLQVSHAQGLWEAPLLAALQEHAVLLGQSPGVHAEMFHLVTPLLRCLDGLTIEPSAPYMRGPEAGMAQLLPVAPDLATIKAARGVRNRIASAMFLPASDNEASSASVSVSPIILDLLRVCNRAFEAPSSADVLLRGLNASPDHALASPAHSILSMQAAAECLDALLSVLLSALQSHVHGSTHRRRLQGDPARPPVPADAEVEEGELLASCDVAAPTLLWALGELHAALWESHRALSAHPWTRSHYERTAVRFAVADAVRVRPPSDRSQSLGHLPRIRVLLHACLSHTLFHLLSPAAATMLSPVLDDDDDRRSLIESAPLSWWQQLFGMDVCSCWHAHIRFLCDILPPVTRGSGPPGSGSERQAWQREQLFRPLFEHLEMGPSSEPLGVILPPRLLSSFLFSDALWSSSSIDVQQDLVELIARIVECASDTVARAIMEACVARMAEEAAKIEATMQHMARSSQMDQPLSSVAVSVPSLRELQLLHSLVLSSSRVRSLLFDVDVLSVLHSLMRLSMPLHPSLRSPIVGVVGSSSIAIPEAIPLQQSAMDIACTMAELPDGCMTHDLASKFAAVLPTACVLLLHPHAPLALTGGRLLLALCRSTAGCMALVELWLKDTPAGDRLRSESFSVGRLGSPLLQWLQVRLCSCVPESSSSCAVGLSLELELWSQVSELMRLISTQGQPQADPQRLHESSRPAPSTADDAWWSGCVAARYPGLPALCALLQWPVRVTPHVSGSRDALFKAHGFTAHKADAAHPLLRILARLQALQDAESRSPSSPRSVCVASLLRCFETIRQRLQLATILHISSDTNKEERHTRQPADEAMASVRMEACMESRQPE